MADKRLKLDIEIGTKQAQNDVKGLAKEARNLGTDIDDTRTAGQKLAAAMQTVADQMESDLAQAVAAADALETAIGVDGVDAFKKAGKSVDDLVDDLRRAGLSYQDVETDAKELATAMQRVAKVGDSIDAHVTKKMEGVAVQTDRSRGVMSNFTGNALTAFPQLSGVMAPVTQAMGEIAENAAEGDIKMSGLAKVAGPMAALGVVLWAVSKGAEQSKKRTDEFKESIEELSRVTDAEVVAAYGRALARAAIDGVSLTDELDDIAEGNREGAMRMYDLMLQAGATEGEMSQLAAAIDRAAAADEREKANTEKYATALDGTTTAIENQVLGLDHLNELQRTAAKRTGELEAATGNLDDQYATLMGKFDKEDAWENLLESLWTAKDGLGDTAQETRDYARDLATMVQGLEGVPPETKADLLLAIDQGRFDYVQRELQKLHDKGVVIPARLSISTGALVTSQGDVIGIRYVPGGPSTNRAAGGPVGKGDRVQVNELGQEMAVFPDGRAEILDHHASQRLLDRRTGAGGYVDARVFHITLPSQTPESLAGELQRFARRNGTG